MLLQMLLVRLIELKESLRRLTSCFRVVAENVNEVCEGGINFDNFDKSNSDESLNSQSSY